MNPTLFQSAQRTLKHSKLHGLSAAAMKDNAAPTRMRNDPTINHSSGGNLAGTPFQKPGMT